MTCLLKSKACHTFNKNQEYNFLQNTTVYLGRPCSTHFTPEKANGCLFTALSRRQAKCKKSICTTRPTKTVREKKNSFFFSSFFFCAQLPVYSGLHCGVWTLTLFACLSAATHGLLGKGERGDRVPMNSSFQVLGPCEPVWPSGKAGQRKDLGSIPLRLSFLFKKVVVCGQCLVTLSITSY